MEDTPLNASSLIHSSAAVSCADDPELMTSSKEKEVTAYSMAKFLMAHTLHQALSLRISSAAASETKTKTVSCAECLAKKTSDEEEMISNETKVLPISVLHKPRTPQTESKLRIFTDSTVNMMGCSSIKQSADSEFDVRFSNGTAKFPHSGYRLQVSAKFEGEESC